jgi:Stress responsive A/B Barrel Domain
MSPASVPLAAWTPAAEPSRRKMMRKPCICGAALALLVAGVLVLNADRTTEAAGGKGPMLVHNVFFSLKDNSPKAKDKLIEACKKYLTKHPGEIYFAAGPIADDFKREVNDRDFDVALTIVFEDRKAHDLYQDAARHKQFIDENKDNWKKVRVFDSLAQP